MSDWFVRGTKADGPWEPVPPRPEDRSLDAVQLVLQAPEFLGECAGGLRRVALTAPGASSGRVLVAVDESGSVTLVACPRDESSDQGPLVTELLAASGGLWHKKFDALAVPFQKANGRSLVDQVKARVGAAWTDKEFKEGVDVSLKQGRFPIVIVARERTKAIDDMLGYLDNLNLKAKVIGYRCFKGSGVEAVEPVVLREDGSTPAESQPEEKPEPAPAKKPEPPKQKPVPKPKPKPKPERPAKMGVFDRVQFKADGSRSTARKVEHDLGKYPEFEAVGASDLQKEILRHLGPLDELGLERRGLEYFVPGAEKKETSEGTVVVAVEHKRWPFPKENEVVVVIRTGKDHLGGFLDVPPNDIMDFLGSLPRMTDREHQGTLLLQAANVNEADHVTNEVRTLLATVRTTQTDMSSMTRTEKAGSKPAATELADASPRQQEILAELEKLEHLGLKHEGMGFYLPGAKPETSDGPVIQLCVDPAQWPKPDREQVIVAVNPGEKHLSRYLSIAPDEIHDFLSSLPKIERTDDGGCILLLAANVEAGTQIASELKALKDIAQTGY